MLTSIVYTGQVCRNNHEYLEPVHLRRKYAYFSGIVLKWSLLAWRQGIHEMDGEYYLFCGEKYIVLESIDNDSPQNNISVAE